MPIDEPHRVLCHLDDLLERRGMTLAALADAVGVTVVNLSVLKNNRAIYDFNKQSISGLHNATGWITVDKPF